MAVIILMVLPVQSADIKGSVRAGNYLASGYQPCVLLDGNCTFQALRPDGTFDIPAKDGYHVVSISGVLRGYEEYCFVSVKNGTANHACPFEGNGLATPSVRHIYEPTPTPTPTPTPVPTPTPPPVCHLVYVPEVNHTVIHPSIEHVDYHPAVPAWTEYFGHYKYVNGIKIWVGANRGDWDVIFQYHQSAVYDYRKDGDHFVYDQGKGHYSIATVYYRGHILHPAIPARAEIVIDVPGWTEIIIDNPGHTYEVCE